MYVVISLILQTVEKNYQVSQSPVRSAKFIDREKSIVAGADDHFIRVYNYTTEEKTKEFKAHDDFIRSLAVHPTLPYVLSGSDDMVIKLWDWEKDWACTRVFKGHNHYVMQVAFNPKENETFTSVSLDCTVKMWNLISSDPILQVEAHSKGINCVDFLSRVDKQYLITGSDDHTAKVWDLQTQTCVQILEGHKNNISALAVHPELPALFTGSEDGTFSVWDATNYRLLNTQISELGRVWAIGFARLEGSHKLILGCDEGMIMGKILIPSLTSHRILASLYSGTVCIWNYQTQTMAKSFEVTELPVHEKFKKVTDGERLPLVVKELGTCDLYPQSLKHNPNGRFVVVCGDGEYILYTALAWRNRSFGSALEFVWSSDGEYAEKKSIRPTFSAERIYGGALLAMCSNDFICFYDWADCRLIRRIDVSVKNLYWADSGDMVAIASDTSFYILKYNRDVVSAHLDSGRSVDEQGVEEAFELLYEMNERVRTGIWVGDCFIYNNSSWRLNYCVGGEVTTMFHLDCPMYLLGYLANQSRVFLIDKEFNVIGYTLLHDLIEYKTFVMRGDWDRANEVLPSIPKEHHNRVTCCSYTLEGLASVFTFSAISASSEGSGGLVCFICKFPKLSLNVFPASVAHFLESRGMIEEALEVATEPDYRFDLAIQLGKLDIEKDIAVIAQSESKWKQLGDLAMSAGMVTITAINWNLILQHSFSFFTEKMDGSDFRNDAVACNALEMAEECLKYANDLSGLLLLYSSLGDAEGITELATLAKEQGKNNVTFLCMFLLGKVEECIQLLVDSNRIPEAAFMVRSYLPSKVSEIVAIWKKGHSKVDIVSDFELSYLYTSSEFLALRPQYLVGWSPERSVGTAKPSRLDFHFSF
ncbi:hypothetical protein RND71_017176 [Anisodus tanguticus]|uniref:Coatomer subunit beta' n=1 Tax=Anisodus tanguticus TaxID=243964 RepID=A0AAE1S1Z6_9SOLA|nr:hypothetical protein RND71_017176 [Anisodus tanguticus]